MAGIFCCQRARQPWPRQPILRRSRPAGRSSSASRQQELAASQARVAQLEKLTLRIPAKAGTRRQAVRFTRHGRYCRGLHGRRCAGRAQRSAPAVWPDSHRRRASDRSASAYRRQGDHSSGSRAGGRRIRVTERLPPPWPAPYPPSDPSMAGIDRLTLPPSSVQAEQALLGGLMLDNSAWDKVADLVTEADFYRPDHRLIFASIRALSERRQPFDAVTISEYPGEPRRDCRRRRSGLSRLAGAGYAERGQCRGLCAHHSRPRPVARTDRDPAITSSAAHFTPTADRRPSWSTRPKGEFWKLPSAGSARVPASCTFAMCSDRPIDRLDMLHQAGGSITGRFHRIHQIRRLHGRSADRAT